MKVKGTCTDENMRDIFRRKGNVVNMPIPAYLGVKGYLFCAWRRKPEIPAPKVSKFSNEKNEIVSLRYHCFILSKIPPLQICALMLSDFQWHSYGYTSSGRLLKVLRTVKSTYL